MKSGVLSQFSASYNAATRRINYLGILNAPPTDFSWIERCLYYTDTKGCTEQCSMWAERRYGPKAKRVILYLYIGKAWIQKLHDPMGYAVPGH